MKIWILQTNKKDGLGEDCSSIYDCKDVFEILMQDYDYKYGTKNWRPSLFKDRIGDKFLIRYDKHVFVLVTLLDTVDDDNYIPNKGYFVFKDIEYFEPMSIEEIKPFLNEKYNPQKKSLYIKENKVEDFIKMIKK